MVTARWLPIALLVLACCKHADIDPRPDGSTSGSESAAGEPAQGASDSGPAAATTSCDPKKILCRRAPPECPEFQAPSVSGSCYGPCVPLEACACEQASDCPNPETGTCHLYARHCGPYVN
jgi:hypothetical protein